MASMQASAPAESAQASSIELADTFFGSSQHWSDREDADTSPLPLDHSIEEVGPHPEFSLAPVDGGKDAWLCLAGCFFIEALVWGFPFSFGIFQQYYSTHEPFASEPGGIPVIGTSATGLMYFTAPIIFWFMQAYPQHRRHCNILGLPIAVLALLASSFATRTSHLVATQGVLYGIGGMLFYTPTIVFLGEWFVRRRGLAFGVMWAGTGFAGVTIPFFLAEVLEKWGWQTALRVWACVLTVLSTPLLYYVKPRVPLLTGSARMNRKTDMSFLRSPTFLIPEFAATIEGLGYFIPSLYLPSYVDSLGLDPLLGTLTVALVNGASVAGTIIVGYLVDRINVSTVMALITLPTVFAVFVLWGLGVSIPALIVFSIIYGVTAGGFSTSCTITTVLLKCSIC